MNATPTSIGAEQILRVAIHLFAQKGYEATSTREIVEAAGVTKPMLYYYFGNKEGLCKAALSRFVDGFLDGLEAITTHDADPREQVVEYVWHHFEHFHEHADISRLYMGLYYGPQRYLFADHIEQLANRLHELGRDFVGRVTARGLLRTGCEEDFFMALHGLIRVWSVHSTNKGEQLSRELAERIVDGLLSGYRRAVEASGDHPNLATSATDRT